MIHFTKHALEKFEILKRHGLNISREKVAETAENPEFIDYSRQPLKIAERALDKTHVLRVVFKEEGEIKTIITFYPGRKSQYEKRK
ncbi:hypothetical protein A3C75_02265 [Candidatus Giovannonibacteria bacterium RIFCSPHIGHO2_02_FULL_44_31]|nr:MAG: hypothetical protein A3C75_02265 [Candidatus Giovannonibacteria bacterium RIFCSPHIGHO2_02_FULL_44_31]OGF76258.1 MAG: hypothetical protein A3E62_03960 [Candidatus Giovannonibacteria bacterium RIFCSPHIGHO2_12_FULL_44_29]